MKPNYNVIIDIHLVFNQAFHTKVIDQGMDLPLTYVYYKKHMKYPTKENWKFQNLGYGAGCY